MAQKVGRSTTKKSKVLGEMSSSKLYCFLFCNKKKI